MSKRKPKKKVRNVITVGLPGGPRTVAEALTKTNAGDVIVCAVKPHMSKRTAKKKVRKARTEVIRIGPSITLEQPAGEAWEEKFTRLSKVRIDVEPSSNPTYGYVSRDRDGRCLECSEVGEPCSCQRLVALHAPRPHMTRGET